MPIFWKNKKSAISLSSAEIGKRVVKVKGNKDASLVKTVFSVFVQTLGKIRYLTLSMLGINFEKKILFFPQYRLLHFMQIVNLHEMVKPIFCEK